MATGVIRSIGGFYAEVTVQEQHIDELTITQHPVERGGAITDHAFKMPSQLNIDIGNSAAYLDQSGSSIDQAYNDLLNLMIGVNLLTVQTGKRLYQNMLIKSLRVNTDQKTENVLSVSMQLQEVFLVDTSTTPLPSNSVAAKPQSTASTTNTGTKSLVSASGS